MMILFSSMPKNVTLSLKLLVTICLVCISVTITNAQISPPLTGSRTDTVADKTKATRIVNQNFDNIYLQNARISTFGNEYGQPIPTQLVADLTGNFVVFATPKSRLAFIFNPRVKLRLLSTPGAPVKSPSYMPGGTLYYRINRDDLNPSFLSASYSHHSNGVRGPTLNPNGTFNTDSGKFTTNFYTLAYTHGKRIDHFNTISNRYETLGIELHSALVGTGYSEALKDRYGFVRLNGNFMYNLAKAGPDAIDGNRTFNNWMRLQIEFSYILDKYDNYGTGDISKRLNISALYFYQFPFMQNVALMAGGGYRGQDDYNIFFQNSYAYFTVGVAAGVSFGFHHK
ncbi:hypothetical protein [Mucilaginibacter myungsuensis]|uniref:Uncharacterized protein n=1 Tax=Mucilaginibacter myungsuensis TaxID=649104 RepID=A0A929L060_9SPHI|nr:hypothetical protein [Mucilaginibacter myungsuensis]MBE9663688.1 hypothetical protein [Mucilaginibacter myungsuensis]MDN3598988.1 hypothetical protein [Mucilaginibacter myungsuensis]